MTLQIRSHRIFNTDLYFYMHFIVEIDEKSGHNGGFFLIRFNDDQWWLIFWATLYSYFRWDENSARGLSTNNRN